MKKYRGQGPEQRSFSLPRAWGLAWWQMECSGSLSGEALRKKKKKNPLEILWKLHDTVMIN